MLVYVWSSDGNELMTESLFICVFAASSKLKATFLVQFSRSPQNWMGNSLSVAISLCISTLLTTISMFLIGEPLYVTRVACQCYSTGKEKHVRYKNNNSLLVVLCKQECSSSFVAVFNMQAHAWVSHWLMIGEYMRIENRNNNYSIRNLFRTQK